MIVLSILVVVFVAASLRWNWWRPTPKGLRTLMYHKFGVPPAGANWPSIWATEAEFRRQLDYLKRHGFTTMLFSEFRDAEAGRIPMPEKPVLITFDDGFANNYEVAYPILKELGMKANIFLVHDLMETDSRWDAVNEPAPPIPMLSWKQIFEMRDSGVIEFGSHTMKHRNLLKLSAEEVRWEVVESKARLEEKLGYEMIAFAYPWGEGAYDEGVRRAVRDAGYRYDFGVRRGITRLPYDPASGPLRRLDINLGTSALDFHLSVTRGRIWINRRFWE